MTYFDPLRCAFHLWLLTNLIGDAGWALWLLPKEKWPIESSELEWAAFFVVCMLGASLVVIPFAKILFAHTLPLPIAKRLPFVSIAILVLWGLPVVILTIFAALDFSASFFNFLFSILPVAASYLGAAYLATLLVYRRWLFEGQL